jgi:ribosomal protein S12 methylthiotransferase
MERVSVALVSLGCAKNLVDSEVMLALLKEEGFELINDPGSADVVVVNTCGFIESAREESVNAILEMALLKKKVCRVLVAAGCLAQRYGEKLMEEMPELDGIVGTGDIAGITEVIRRCLLSGESCVYSRLAPGVR